MVLSSLLASGNQCTKLPQVLRLGAGCLQNGYALFELKGGGVHGSRSFRR